MTFEAPAKRDEKLVRPLIRDFVTHFSDRFGMYPPESTIKRVINAILKKKQEEFIETTFSGQNWKNEIDLYDVSTYVAERVMELKETDAVREKDDK